MDRYMIDISSGNELIMTLCVVVFCVSGHQSGFCMICIMQNHIIQAFANTGNAIKPVSFIRDLKSKTTSFPQHCVIVSVHFAPACFNVGCVRSHRHLVFVWMTQPWPQYPVWQQQVTAVHKWSGETAGCEWTACREKRCALHLDMERCCAVVSQESSLHPVPLPTCLLLPYVLLQSCLHLLRLFFCPPLPLHLPLPPSFHDALSVSLWLRAERSSFQL